MAPAEERTIAPRPSAVRRRGRPYERSRDAGSPIDDRRLSPRTRLPSLQAAAGAAGPPHLPGRTRVCSLRVLSDSEFDEHTGAVSPQGRSFARPLAVVALVFGLLAVSATAAGAHGDEENTPASDLVRIAIAVLEVHPAPGAAVEDKIIDAQEATDKSDVDIALVKQAGEALARGDIAATKRLLEQSLGECPDADVLFVSDQSPKPPCVAPAHALAVARKSVGGTSEVIILIIAALLAIAGLVVLRNPFVRRHERSAA